MIKDFVEEHRNNLLILAGAGVSMDPPSCLPSAKSLMDSIIDFCALGDYGQIIKKIPNLRYEYVVQEFRDLVDHDLDFLDFFVDVEKPNKNHFMLADQIIQGNLVITTNFDILVEQALANLLRNHQSSNKKCKAIITKEDFLECQKDPHYIENFFTLLKFHGSPINYFTRENTKSSVVTTLDNLSLDIEDEQNPLSLPAYKEDVFQSLDKNRFLIVLGYGGGDTFDIIPEINAMSELKGILWINHIPNSHNASNWNIFEGSQKIIDKIFPGSIQEVLSQICRLRKIPVFEIGGTTSSILEFLFPHHSQVDLLVSSESAIFLSKFSNWLVNELEPPSKLKKILFSEHCLKNYQQYLPALDLLKSLKELSEAKNDLKMLAYSYNEMGIIYSKLGESLKALDYYEHALTLDKKIGNTDSLSTDYLNIGSLHQILGNYDKAYEYLNQAYEINFKAGDQQAMVSSLIQLGALYHGKEDWEAALRYYNWAKDEAREVGHQGYISSILNNIGEIYRETGKYEKANEFYEQSLAIDRALGNQQAISVKFNNLGLIHQFNKKFQKAMEYFNNAHEIAQIFGDRRLEAITLNNLGGVYFSLNQLEKSLECFKKALPIYLELHYAQGIEICEENIIELELLLY